VTEWPLPQVSLQLVPVAVPELTKAAQQALLAPLLAQPGPTMQAAAEVALPLAVEPLELPKGLVRYTSAALAPPVQQLSGLAWVLRV